MLPSLIYIALIVLSLGVTAATHGQYVRRSFWHSLIAVAIVFSLLHWGGFFAPLLAGL